MFNRWPEGLASKLHLQLNTSTIKAIYTVILCVLYGLSFQLTGLLLFPLIRMSLCLEILCVCVCVCLQGYCNQMSGYCCCESHHCHSTITVFTLWSYSQTQSNLLDSWYARSESISHSKWPIFVSNNRKTKIVVL